MFRRREMKGDSRRKGNLFFGGNFKKGLRDRASEDIRLQTTSPDPDKIMSRAVLKPSLEGG